MPQDMDGEKRPRALQAGSSLASYEIRELLGVGGMGEVYRAHDTRLGRDVALKVLPTDLSTDPARLSRFEREARAASALNHPNIVTIHEFGRQGDIAFLVMEWVDGKTLRDRLAEGPLSLSALLDVATQVADGLAKAHEAGIVHRDLKPENLMLTKDGFVKILDFGLAKLPLSGGSDSAVKTLTAASIQGVVLGTVGYMSPEQAHGLPVDSRSDQFSFAAILYEMATRRRAFQGSSPVDTLAAILEREPPLLHSLSPTAPPELERIVVRCLSKEREGRYDSTRDLAADLRRLRDHPTASLPAIAPATAGRARRTVRFYLALAGTIAAATLAALFGLSLFRRGEAIRSLAVLPFANATGDPNAEYLSEGLTESLIGTLSRLPSLAVMARSSVIRYRGKDVDPQIVGKDLNVQTMVAGRVQKNGDDWIVRVELVDTASRRVLWSEEYRRKTSDLLTIQTDLMRDVTERLRPRLATEDLQRLTSATTTSSSAWQAYLKGRYIWARRPVGISKAFEALEEAIRLDPRFALAHAGLAEAFMTLGSWENGTQDPRSVFPRAKAEALEAMKLDPALGEPHAPLAYTALHFDWDWTLSEREFRRAIELSPKYAPAHHWYSHLLTALRRKEESLAESQRVLALEPAETLGYYHIAWHHQLFREFDDALVWAKKCADLDPNQAWCAYFAGLALEQKGRLPEAITAFENAVTIGKGATGMKSALGHVLAKAERRQEAEAILKELKDLKATRYVSAYEIGLIHLALGEVDEGFRWLEKSFGERSAWLVYLEGEPRLDAYRSDPRLQDLIRRVGLPH